MPHTFTHTSHRSTGAFGAEDILDLLGELVHETYGTPRAALEQTLQALAEGTTPEEMGEAKKAKAEIIRDLKHRLAMMEEATV